MELIGFLGYIKNIKVKEMNRLSYLIVSVFILLTVSSCNSKKGNEAVLDTPTSGKIKIAVDETFRPIIDSEIMVFEGIYPNAQIEPIYLPENKLFEQIGNDSVRLIISSRLFSEKEKQFFLRKQLFPKDVAIAKDAIAVVVNNSNSDSILSISQIRDILTGKVTSWKSLNAKSKLDDIEIVFDNVNSSTVRYSIDSICKGDKITSYITALNKNTDVVDYVSKHKGSIGFIGSAWVSDRDDSTQVSFMKKVKIAYLSSQPVADYDNSYQPYAAYVYQGSYPFSRYMYALSTDPRNGLPSGFVSFLASDKGQRIILKFGIVPATAPTRVVQVRETY